MPKKAGATRTGASRNRAKAQKSFEVVRPAGEPQETVESPEDIREELPVKVSETRTAKSTTATTAVQAPEKVETATEANTNEKVETATEANTNEKVASAPKGSAAAKLAARRQATQRAAQQRNAATLITAEHFAYVKRDMVTIGVLASVMIVAILVLYFTIGRA
jgi:predicted RND superfamily exporter protein